jgi:hypothetical protein
MHLRASGICWAKDYLPDIRVGPGPILGRVFSEDNTVGALEGRTPVGALTFVRVSTDDLSSTIKGHVGEGTFAHREGKQRAEKQNCIK